MPRFPVLGEVNYPYSLTINGQHREMWVNVVTKQHPQYACCTEYTAIFVLNSDEAVIRWKVGRCTGITINKLHERDPDRPDSKPDWLTSLLQVPSFYDGDVTSHTESAWDLGDLQKVMQILFDENGRVRDRVQEHTDALARERIHYISEFVIYDDFRGGKGYAQVAMAAYLAALQHVSDGHSFVGAVVLAPAPMGDYDPMFREETGLATLSDVSLDAMATEWIEKKLKIIRSYERSGFRLWYPGNTTTLHKISVMGIVADSPSLADGSACQGHGRINDLCYKELAVRRSYGNQELEVLRCFHDECSREYICPATSSDHQ